MFSWLRKQQPSMERASELVKVGLLHDGDNLTTVKCAELFGLDPNPHILVVVHSGARLDETAATLGEFLASLPAQQKSKLSLGISTETKAVQIKSIVNSNLCV